MRVWGLLFVVWCGLLVSAEVKTSDVHRPAKLDLDEPGDDGEAVTAAATGTGAHLDVVEAGAPARADGLSDLPGRDVVTAAHEVVVGQGLALGGRSGHNRFGLFRALVEHEAQGCERVRDALRRCLLFHVSIVADMSQSVMGPLALPGASSPAYLAPGPSEDGRLEPCVQPQDGYDQRLSSRGHALRPHLSARAARDG